MSFLLWLDAAPPRFWTLCFVSLGALLASACAPAFQERASGRLPGTALHLLRQPITFVILGALAILAFRWPALFFPWLLDHDEAQMGAQAIKYFTDFVPWRSVDGTTSGPLNSWWLMVPGILGWGISWMSIRLMGLICVFATFCFTYGTFRRISGEAIARVAVLPLAFFYLFVTSISFLHYTSEHVPVMLISGGFYFAARLAHGDAATMKSLIPAAVLFGAVPFAKLQATPIGALGGILLLTILIGKTKRAGRDRTPACELAAWAMAGASVPVLFFFLVLNGRALADFWISYVGQLTTYKQIGHAGGSLSGLLWEDRQVIALVIAGAVAGMVLLGVAWKRRRLWRIPAVWTFVYIGVALFCVLWSGKHHPHYFLFLVHPICLCLGLLTAATRKQAPDGATESRAAGISPWLLIAPVLAVQLSQLVAVVPGHPHIGNLPAYREPPSDPLVRAIRQVSNPGDRLTVWGLTPSLHVDTGLAPGTRDAITQMQILPSSRQEYYRERFLNDLKATRPKVFVDTDSPYLMMDGGSFAPYVMLPAHGHEVFPRLAAFIAGNYEKVYEARIGRTKHVIRVYSRQ